MIITMIVTVCGIGFCDPIEVKYDLPYYGSFMESGPIINDAWCSNSAQFYIRDISKVNPETKDIYYINPKLSFGIQGLTFIPDTIQCGFSKGNEQ